jgi:DNA-binding CsgD family transcriptional regulator
MDPAGSNNTDVASAAPEPQPDDRCADEEPEPKLTPQQLMILSLANRGHSIDEIALTLKLARRTVHKRLRDARKALGAETRAGSVAKARELGLFDPLPYRLERMADYDPGISVDQRLYLDAFDRHLQAGDDEQRLERIKLLTDAALEVIGCNPGRSVAAREWMTEQLLDDMARG